MFEKLQLTAMAQAMSAHAGSRMGIIARNVAHADTPGYKAMDLPSFAEAYRAAEPDGLRQTRPGHLSGLEAEAMTFSPRCLPTSCNTAHRHRTNVLSGHFYPRAEGQDLVRIRVPSRH